MIQLSVHHVHRRRQHYCTFSCGPCRWHIRRTLGRQNIFLRIVHCRGLVLCWTTLWWSNVRWWYQNKTIETCLRGRSNKPVKENVDEKRACALLQSTKKRFLFDTRMFLFCSPVTFDISQKRRDYLYQEILVRIKTTFGYSLSSCPDRDKPCIVPEFWQQYHFCWYQVVWKERAFNVEYAHANLLFVPLVIQIRNLCNQCRHCLRREHIKN